MDGLTPLVAPLIELVKSAGPYAPFILMFYLWKNERDERIATQESFRRMTSDNLTAVNGMTDAIRELRFTIFGRHTDH